MTQVGAGNCVAEACVPGGDQRKGDDPHRLLRVIGPVREGDERRREQLPPSEDSIYRAWRPAANQQEHTGGHERCSRDGQ